jgi:single-strand DNA-binding protein
VWKELGEHVASSLSKGARVIAQGRLKQRTYETKEGEKKTVMELEIDEIGPSLRYATASVTKATGNRNQADNRQRSQQAPAAGQPAAAFNDDTPF